MKKLALVFMSLFLLTGCYNMQEINELAITTMIGIDYEDGLYKVSAGIVNFKDEKETMEIISSTGPTVMDAINNINTKYPKTIYLDHLKILILSKNVIKNNSLDSINYLVNYPGTGLNFYILVSDDKLTEIINNNSSSDNITTNAILNGLKNAYESTSSIPMVTLDMFLNDLISDTKSPILPIISLTDDNLFILDESIIINKENEINYLNKEESIGYNILLSKTNNVTLSSSCNGGNFEIDLKDIKTDISLKNHNKFIINIKTRSDIGDYYCDMKRSIKTENFIKSSIKELINEYVNKTINKSIETKTDFIGFGRILYAYDYKYYKKIESKYEKEYLKDIEYDINIDLKFSNTGNLRRDIKGSD